MGAALAHPARRPNGLRPSTPRRRAWKPVSDRGDLRALVDPGRVKTRGQKNWWEKLAGSYRAAHLAWGETEIQRLSLDFSGEVVGRIWRIRAFSHDLDPKRTYRQRCQCRLRPASGLSCDAVAIADRCVGGGLLQRQKATLRRRAVMSAGSRAPRAGLTYWTSAVSLAQGVRPRLCHASMPFSSLKSSTGSRLSCSPSETLKAKAPMPKRS